MERIYKRKDYVSKIRGFYKDDMIKVISGIRRCGKSFFLKSIIQELLEDGVNEKDIIYRIIQNDTQIKKVAQNH